jgi:3-oxoacyl-[acyl-carrier protein] reductase
MDKELNGRVAIVTGGAQGIGAAIAKTLRREGASVVIADLNEAAAKEMSASLGEDCSAFKMDISSSKDQEALVQHTLDTYGKIDILINNAGISAQVDFFDLTEEEFDKFTSVNLKGMLFLTQKVMQAMVPKKYGRIVNIASLAGERGGLFAGIHYSTSKAGVIVATKCMAHKGGIHNITVNAVAPGLINTQLAEALKFDTDEIAMKRLGSTQEVAEAVAFLASDRASYITGSTVDVNGGIFMR